MKQTVSELPNQNQTNSFICRHGGVVRELLVLCLTWWRQNFIHILYVCVSCTEEGARIGRMEMRNMRCVSDVG